MQKILLKIWNKGITDKQISKNAFDLILSFDDLITLNGYRDSVTMSQLDAYLEMDSTDEKMHKKARIIREKEAKEIAKKHQKDIAKKAKDNEKAKKELGLKDEDFEDSKMGSSGSRPTPTETKEPKFEPKAPKGKGMQLGKPKKLQSTNNSKFDFGAKDSLFKTDEEKGEDVPVVQEKKQKIDLEIQELVNWEVTKFGDISKLNVKGTVSFLIKETKSKITEIAFLKPKESLFKQFKVHPDIDKNQWKDRGILSATDQEEGFNPEERIEAITYKYISEEESQLPFDISIFTSKAAGGKVKVAFELEFKENPDGANNKFTNISIKTSIEDEPKLLNIENSSTNLSATCLSWEINELSDEYPTAALQFHTKSSEETMFPIKISYSNTNTGDNTDQLFIRLLLIQ